MTFGTLAIIMAAGTCGPLLAAWKRNVIPVVVGELAAGALLGAGGLRVLNPHQETFAFLANGGFVMLMFGAGMHVPVRSLARSLLSGFVGAALCAGAGIVLGLIIEKMLGGPGLVYALLMANSSAAVILPLVQERALDQDRLAATLALVTIADVLTIVTLPLVLEPSRLGASLVGMLAVIGTLAALAGLARALRGRAWVTLLRHRSRKHGWALELRVSLIAAFVLAAVAQRTGISLMIAGFSAGLLLSWLGGKKRLDRQVAAVAQGFFVPIFFVSLGAKLDVTEALTRPSLLALTFALVLGAGVVHVLSAALLRRPLMEGLLASAQLGLPAAAADLGLKAHVLTPGQAAAIMCGGLGAIALSVIAAARLKTRQPDPLLTALAEQLSRPSSWRSDAGRRELKAAEALLTKMLAPEEVREAIRQLGAADEPTPWKAKDILAAAELAPLPAAEVSAKRKLSRLSKGKRLAPVLLVHRPGKPTIVADGYRLASTGYHANHETLVPALEATL